MGQPADRLVSAITEVLLDEGFEGISVRKVAARAGVSIGAVQHHFPTKDGMLTAAMDAATADFQDGLARSVPADASPEQALRGVATALLAAHPRARVGTVLWVARLARAAVDPATAARHAAEWAEVADLLTRLVAAAVPAADADWSRDTATTLLGLVDGLAIAVLREPERMPAERAVTLVERQIDDLLSGP